MYFYILQKLNSQKTKLENFILKSHNREIFDGTIYQGYLQKLLYERLFSSKPNQTVAKSVKLTKNSMRPTLLGDFGRKGNMRCAGT